ncbi:sigma-70 family RNA polymerase sigma factor [Solirhodobacter olei]|uniref:sigma-70 family RNA polymerase sigma factor n=1 Tax=Solirhodobacter olei TaxID=2493082 RepID=UPI000FD7B49C|nr:sigma-70 family RNA polymerase sigma factor [Solirhodobacter olei]
MALNYREALNAPLLDEQAEREAIQNWQRKGDRAALELLVRTHARQVYSQAQRWTSNPVELEDLVAEGMIGLMRAADQFDLAHKVRFSTYAHWWVMTSVSTAVARIRSLVDMPPRTYLDARMGRLSGADKDFALQAIRGYVNIDAMAGDQDSPRGQELESPDMTPEERFAADSAHELLRRTIAEALEDLAEPDREVLVRRKLQATPETAEEVASSLGITRDRVRMIERRAMARLKLSLQRLGFTPAMLH